MLALPEGHQSRPFWQYAAELLIDAAERSNRASVDNAAAQLSRALASDGLLWCSAPARRRSIRPDRFDAHARPVLNGVVDRVFDHAFELPQHFGRAD
jgi:hypothetical protein